MRIRLPHRLRRSSPVVPDAQRGVRGLAKPPHCPPDWSVGPPDFVIYGAPKAGTTRWQSLLAAHPDVHFRRREVHFFDGIAARWLTADDIARYHSYFPRPPGSITGEKTPGYMSIFWSARMLAEAAPDARVIVLLRDPVDRYISDRTHHERLREREMGRRVPQARFERETVKGCFERGRYASQMEVLYDSFPREQVQVVQFEASIREPVEQLARTYAFLGLAPFVPEPAVLERRVNPAKAYTVETEPERLELITRLYRTDVTRLKRLVPDLDLTLWRNFADLADLAGASDPAIAADTATDARR